MKYEFVAISMKTKSGKYLYLKEGYGNSYEWTFDYEKAIWFDTTTELEKFAKRYFKKFKDWEIKDVYTIM